MKANTLELKKGNGATKVRSNRTRIFVQRMNFLGWLFELRSTQKSYYVDL